MTRKIVSMKFGSSLYGTSTPTSNVDLKSVFVPDLESILLQRVKGSVSTKREKVEGEKNFAGEIDEESYAVQRYLALLAEGQTVALDMLFAPDWAMTMTPSWEWRQIVANKHRLITKKSAAFVGYCHHQANKYGIKGSRVAAARLALHRLDAVIDDYRGNMKLGEFSMMIERVVAATEHMTIEAIEQIDGRIIKYWNVCGRKLQYTATIRHARDVMANLVDEYGARALQAESQQGVDWKALSHAVRVGHQAIELLGTGYITFPLPNAEHVLAIKTGSLPYQEVSAEIEALLVAVEDAAAKSSLPDEPDKTWIDEFVAAVHCSSVIWHGVGLDLVERAKVFATAAHAAVKQVRKYTNEPYIVHPAAVVELVSSVPHSQAMLAAAWLHDSVEDTGITLPLIHEHFGGEISALVGWLTNVPKSPETNREQRKKLDIARLSQAPEAAQTIKLADLIDNTLTIEARDPNFAVRFRREKRDLLEVMTGGDPALRARVLRQIEEASR